jgi:hypothetical protein
MWIWTLDLRVGKCSRLVAIQPFLFRSWEMTILTSSVRFVQNLLISMPLGWWKHGDPNIFQYLSRIYPVLNSYFRILNKTPAFKKPVKKHVINPWEPVKKLWVFGVWPVGCHNRLLGPLMVCTDKIHEKTGRLLIVKYLFANTRFKLLCMYLVCKNWHCLSEHFRRKVVDHAFEKCRNSSPTKSLARHDTRPLAACW